LHKAYIPSGLAGKVGPSVAYFLSSVSWQAAIKKFKDHRQYVSLKLTYLRAVIGRNGAGKAIEESLDRKLVRTDGSWLAGKESRGYKIEEPWIDQRVVPMELPEELSARILSWQARQIKEAIAGKPERQFVFDNLRSLSFRSGIKAVFAKHSARVPALNTRIQSVGRIEDSNWWFSADVRTGRIYHNASSLPRDCRGLLLVDGQPAAETDIANCQPFLLAGLYPGPSAERTRFMDLCISGGFYERLNSLFDEPFSNRDELKVATYQNIMYGNKWHSTQPTFLAFAREWPILGGMIAGQKLGKGGKSNLPLAMQKAEADLVVGRVIPRVMREMPGVPVLTVHDSLLLGSRYANDAAEIVRQELVAQYGACPPVRLK
jgi:hypothetical protein